MIVKVMPQVETIYKDLPGANLPFVTIALLAISHFVTSYFIFILIGLIVLSFALSKYARTGPGKLAVDRFKMRGLADRTTVYETLYGAFCSHRHNTGS